MSVGLHAYCVVPAPRVPRIAGIDGAPVRSVALPPVAVWVSEHRQQPAPIVSSARTHDAVIRGAHDADVTPVPLRFGHWYADDACLVEAVRGRVSGWAVLLHELAGTVELGVRVTDSRGVDPAPAAGPAAGTGGASGTAYMQALLARHRADAAERARRDALLDALRAAFAGRVVREFVAAGAEADVLSVAYLVRRPDLPACLAAIESVQQRFAELRFLTTGPWPPYSFVA